MIRLTVFVHTVFVHRDASLRRIEEIARELQEKGLRVAAVSPGLGVISGDVDSSDVISRVRAVRDVTAVRESFAGDRGAGGASRRTPS